MSTPGFDAYLASHVARQAKGDAEDMDLPEEELRQMLSETDPPTVHIDQELRQLEREATSSKAELDALRGKHEQARAQRVQRVGGGCWR